MLIQLLEAMLIVTYLSGWHLDFYPFYLANADFWGRRKQSEETNYQFLSTKLHCYNNDFSSIN